MILRPYQVGAIDALRARVASGVRRIVLIAPTGAGKTVMASEMIRSATARGRRTVFIAHRKELIDQSFEKLTRFGVNAGVIMGSDRRRDDYFPVQVCSIQTLSRRKDRLPPGDLVVVDEAHHSLANTYGEVLDAYPAATVVGLTATPWPNGKLTLAERYEESVLAATPAELMAMGALVQYDAFAYDSPDLHEVGVMAGDYNQKQLAVACNTTVLVGSVVREYLEHARGRRGILFPVDVAHSRSLVDDFHRAGVAAEHLDCHTPKVERERILAGLASGAVTIVSSVGVLTEGFDCPAAEVCILARPTQSLTLHLQMIGRVLRPHQGKDRALIHDHAGNLMRHGFPDDDRDYSLTTTPKRARELHSCPFCCNVFGSVRPDGTCPRCGELIAPAIERAREERGRSEKKLVEGRRISADEIRALRAERADAGLRTDLTDAQLVKAKYATMEQKAAEYMRLLQVAQRRGFKLGFAAHAYRDTFGVWPRFSDEYLEHVEPSATAFLPLPPKKERAA